MKVLLIAALLFPALALAQTGVQYMHPSASGVVIAGSEGTVAQVCYYESNVFDLDFPDAAAETTVPVWACDNVQLFGGRGPVYYWFPGLSPVKVVGAKWAYALIPEGEEEVDLRPMQPYYGD